MAGTEPKKVVWPVMVMRDGKVTYEEREEKPAAEEYGPVSRGFIPVSGEWDEWGRK